MPLNKCTICGEPIHLTPTAEERAKMYGNTAKYYRDLFTEHSECVLKKRHEIPRKNK